MKKSQEVIGLPVFSIVDGKKIGQVKDLVVNPEEGRVDFILVSNGSWYVGARILPYSDVMGIGEHAVTTESEAHLTSISDTSSANSLLQRNIEVKGNRVLTSKGNLIGMISEYEIDESTGRIIKVAYKTAEDEKNIEYIDSDDVLTYGTDVVVVKENPVDPVPSTPLSTKVANDNNDDNAKEVSIPASSGSTALFKERQRQFLIGKKVIQDIKDSKGKIIISEGTIIDEAVCSLAEEKGKFIELSQCAK